MFETEIRRYAPEEAAAWNRFVAESKQGTFLFNRNYMDYHADRFKDHSLTFWHKGRICALLPANSCGTTLYSHQGLTYGGLLTGPKSTTVQVCDMFKSLNAYLKQEQFTQVVYKTMPWIYHRWPAEEDLYALTQICHARLIARHISSTLILQHRLKFTESRKSGIRKAKREGITVGESDDLTDFWNILEQNLEHKYGTRSVHTLSELQLLKSRFPQNIRLYMACKEGRPLGGTLIYETPQVIHTQYISASPEGKAKGVLDLLFDHLINQVYKEMPYFDFGKSSEGNGERLNAPLIFQKEGFGGRGVCYDWYEWKL